MAPREYEPPFELEMTTALHEEGGSSVPVMLLTHKQPKDGFVIIYSHGNSSDLSDAIVFLEGLALHYNIDVLGYDYSGYG